MNNNFLNLTSKLTTHNINRHPDSPELVIARIIASRNTDYLNLIKLSKFNDLKSFFSKTSNIDLICKHLDNGINDFDTNIAKVIFDNIDFDMASEV